MEPMDFYLKSIMEPMDFYLKSIMEPIGRFLPIIKHSTSGWPQLDHMAVETQLNSFSSVLREEVKNSFCN